MPFEIVQTPEASGWMAALGDRDRHALAALLLVLEEHGPDLGRPLVDRIQHSSVHKLKELRIQSSNLRVLFAFDSNRRAVLLIGGDKTNDWRRWYRGAIPTAEQRLARHERELGKGVTCPSPRTGARSLDR